MQHLKKIWNYFIPLVNVNVVWAKKCSQVNQGIMLINQELLLKMSKLNFFFVFPMFLSKVVATVILKHRGIPNNVVFKKKQWNYYIQLVDYMLFE